MYSAVGLADKFPDEMKIKVYDWCSKVNPYDKHEISKSLRFPNTVLWIFDCDEYKVWVEEDNSAIWLYGIRKTPLPEYNFGMLIVVFCSGSG